MMETVYQDTSEQILALYPPPCMNNNDPDCSCRDVASDWLTGKLPTHFFFYLRK